jgi:hypothetical protein
MTGPSHAAAEKLVRDEHGHPTPAYRAYQRFRHAHQHLQADHDAARTAAMRDPVALQNWPATGRVWADRLAASEQRWRTEGHKDEIEAALAVLEQTPRT